MKRHWRSTAARGTALVVLLTAPLYFGGVTPGYTLLAVGLLATAAALAFAPVGRAVEAVCPRRLALAVCLTVGALSAAGLFSEYRRMSLESFLYWSGLGLVFFLSAALFNDLKRWRGLAVGLVTLAAAVALWGLLNWLLDVRQVWGEAVGLDRGGAHGTFINRNHFAGYLTLLFPFGLVLYLRARSLSGKIALAVANCLIAAGVAFSLSRGAWLGLLASVGVMGLLRLDQRSRRGRVFWLGVLLFVIIGGVLIQLGLEPLDWRLGQSSTEAQLASIGGRMVIWRSAAAMFLAHPVLGCGPGTFGWMFPMYRAPGANSQAWFAHSDYLQALAEAGLVGAAAVIGLVVVLAGLLLSGMRTARRPIKQSLFLATQGALVAVLVEVSFDFHTHILACAYTLAALLGAAVANRSGETVRLHAVCFAPALLLLPAAAWLGLANLKLEESRLLAVLERETPSVEALAVARRVDPDNAEAHFEWGERWALRARFGLNRSRAFEPAWQGYLDALRAFPLDGRVWLRAGMLAEAAAGLHRAPLGGAEMAPVLERLATMERRWDPRRGGDLNPWRYYRRALELDPNNPYYHDIAAIHFLRRGDRAAAERHVERAVALLPDLGYHQPLRPFFGEAAFRELARRGMQSALQWTPDPTGIHLTLGLWALDAGRPDEAAGHLEMLQRRGPSDDPRRIALAAGVAVGQRRDAEAVALWLAYGDAQSWSAGAAGQAYAFFDRPERAAARERFLAGLAGRSGAYPRVALLTARAAEARSDVAGAIQALESYGRRFPDDVDALNRLYRLYTRCGDRVRAEETLRRVIRLRPEEPNLYLELGRVLVAQDLAEQAIPELEMAVRQFPDNAALLEYLALLYERKGRFTLAAGVYQRLTGLRPSDRALQLRVCRSYLLAGDRDKARQCYTALLATEPGDETARRELDALR